MVSFQEGTAPISVKERRLQQASFLLLTTADTLPEICSKIGIESLSYFNIILKKRFRCTPAKFPKEQKHRLPNPLKSARLLIETGRPSFKYKPSLFPILVIREGRLHNFVGLLP